MRFYCVFFVLLFSCSFSHITDELSSFEKSKTHSTVNNCVNTISGNFCLSQIDLVVSAFEPIIIKRVYSSGGKDDEDGGWSFFPHSTLSLFPNWNTKSVYACEPSGVLVRYDCKKEKYFPFVNENTPGAVNTREGEITARNNVKNNKLEFKEDKKKAIIYPCDGGSRIYLLKKVSNEKHYYFLDCENKPNGNKVLYSWENDRISSIRTTNSNESIVYAWVNFKYFGRKEKNHDFTITTSDGQTRDYRFLRGKDRDNNKFYLSDAFGPSSICEHFTYEDCHKLQSYNLSLGRAIGVVYHLIKEKKTRSKNPYDKHFEKCNENHFVKSIKSPIGPSQEDISTHVFHYSVGKKKNGGYEVPGQCLVRDLNHSLTRYFFSKEMRISEIEYYQKIGEKSSKKYPDYKTDKEFNHMSSNDIIEFSCKQKFFWGGGQNSTNLISKALCENNNNVLLAKYFVYDERGNVLEESVLGNLCGDKGNPIYISGNGIPSFENTNHYNKYYSYSNDGFNLTTIEREDNGAYRTYEYKPGTNLLTAKFEYENGKIVKRSFLEYNQDNVLIKEIYDDGASTDKNDVSSITERIIKIIQPKKEQPGINFPEVVEEKYFDLEKNQEILLKKTIYSYSPRGYVTKEDIYDANNTFRCSLKTFYNNKNLVIGKTNPLGQENTYEYNENNDLISSKEAGSQITTKMYYDRAGRVIRKDEISNETKNFFFEYDFKNNLITSVDHNGHSTKYTYDGYSNPTSTVYPTVFDENRNPLNPKVTTSHDLYGNVISITNAKGETTLTKYNSINKPIEIIQSDETKIKKLYYSNGNLKTTINEDKSEVHYEYNSFGKIILEQVLSPSHEILREKKWQYHAEKLLNYESSTGEKITYFYDGAGRKIKEIQNDDKVTVFEYDALGFLYSTINFLTPEKALKNITIRDVLGRIIEEREENLEGIISSKRLYEYDESGNKHKIVTFNASHESVDYFFYDAYNRIIKQVDPLGNTTYIHYNDSFKNVHGQFVLQKSIVDPEGNITQETYDPLNRIVSIERKNPLSMILAKEELFYDLAGNKSLQISSIYLEDKLLKTIKTAWIYNFRDAVTKIIEAQDSDEEKVTEYIYDDKGRKGLLIKPDRVEIRYIYDYLDRLIVIKTFDNTCNYYFLYGNTNEPIEIKDLVKKTSIKRSYDKFNRLIHEEQASGLTIEKEYDNFDRLTKLTLPDKSSIAYIYDEAHLKEVVRLSSYQEEKYSHKYLEYDLSKNLLKSNSILPEYAQFQMPELVQFQVDELGRTISTTSSYFTQKIETFSPSGMIKKIITNSLESSYEYDHLYQLTAEKGVFNHNYLNDSHCNIVQKDNEKYEINDLNEVTSHFVYDANGNPIQSQKNHYEYDALDRLITFTKENICLHFTYDAYHRRVSKTKLINKNDKWEEVSKVYFLYLDDTEIGSTDENFAFIDLKILGFDKESPVALEINYQVSACFNDLLGNIGALVSLNNNDYEKYNYSSYGEQRITYQQDTIPLSTFDNNFGFCSKHYDSDLDLYYFGKRYYSTTFSRWLTPDPANFLDGLNLYAYAHNSPVNRRDLFGLEACVRFDRINQFDQYQRERGAGFENVMTHLMTTARTILNYTGKAIEFLGKNLLLPIPIVQDAVIFVGRVLQLNFCPPEKESNPYTQIIDQKSSPNKNLITCSLNGILNDKEDAQKMGDCIYEMTEGQCGHVSFCEPSRGFMHDFLECILLKFGKNTPNSRAFKEELRTLVSQLQDNGKLHLTVHSRGALLADLAIKGLTKEEREKICILAVGPAKILSNDLCHDVVNLISNRDPVPWTDVCGITKCLFSNRDNVKILRSKDGPFMHGFRSKTYQKGVRDEIRFFMQEQNVKNNN